ncbi:hypothetical protein Cyrtocomes_00326 [Candidatus Cyrtobacter comes]|uniref:Uncharacterized protein n=1 Tax=Candidatus Cyrtobacter comes TaxID=675776 RepID=A0ABU5L7E0_9RICK|nr:hypothetical protein [Candidatus Cyrtobacter comes]MDZ5761962.1 hypothetical protein [Candidatus Cyrtobacter comes]
MKPKKSLIAWIAKAYKPLFDGTFFEQSVYKDYLYPKLIVTKLLLKVALILYIYISIDEMVTSTQRWKEFRSPYSVMLRYYRVMHCTEFQGLLLDIGLTEDNFLFQYLGNVAQKDLQHIKEVVPKDDCLVDMVEWDVKFRPYFRHGIYDQYHKYDELKAWLKSIKYHKSHSNMIETRFKFLQAAHCFRILMKNANQEASGIPRYADKLQKIIKVLLEYEKEIDEFFSLIEDENNFIAKSILQREKYVATTLKITLLDVDLAFRYDKELCLSPFYKELMARFVVWEFYLSQATNLSQTESYEMSTSFDYYQKCKKNLDNVRAACQNQSLN